MVDERVLDHHGLSRLLEDFFKEDLLLRGYIEVLFI